MTAWKDPEGSEDRARSAGWLGGRSAILRSSPQHACAALDQRPALLLAALAEKSALAAAAAALHAAHSIRSPPPTEQQKEAASTHATPASPTAAHTRAAVPT
jgi:hypothetical protein